MHLARAAALATLTAACTTPDTNLSEQPVPRRSQAKIVASVTSTMSPAVDPCQDFYQYACGGWLAATKLPDDESRWVRSFNVIARDNRALLHTLIQPSPQPGPKRHPEEERAITFWAACNDEQRLADRGAEPLIPWLRRADAATTPQALLALTGDMHRHGMSALFSFRVSPDPKQPDRYIAQLSQGGLGLPDRKYYLDQDQRAIELRAAYTAHITTSLSMLGVPADDATQQAALILELETTLAVISLPRDQLRDPEKTYNKVNPAQLKAMAPDLPLDAYFTALGLAAAPDATNVRVPTFFQQLGATLAQAKPEALAAYARWHIVRSNASILTPALEAASFDFYGKTLSGAKQQQPRWERCIQATDRALPHSVGRMFVQRAFSPRARDIAFQLVASIREGFAARINTLDWMDAPTKQRAQGKLATIFPKMGYPDAWDDYSAIDVKPDTYFENTLNARRFDTARDLKRLGGPVDLAEWFMSAPTVNAYYTPFGNQIVFPAGILQAPFFDEAFPPAMNFGGIGMVIGHEITHGFDDSGRKFDEAGRLTQWWSDASVAAFEQRAACVEQLYSSIEAAPGITINGKLTLGENIADLGGVRLAWDGWQHWRAKHPGESSPVPGLTPEQLFFVGFAQSWCALTSDEAQRLRLVTDSHSPPEWRVNATLSQTPMFHEAFSCPVGAPMRPAQVCQVW
jgi:predicted metalloendopeptidase